MQIFPDTPTHSGFYEKIMWLSLNRKVTVF